MSLSGAKDVCPLPPILILYAQSQVMIISKSKQPSLLLDVKSAIICSLGVYLFETIHISMMIILLHPLLSTDAGK